MFAMATENAIFWLLLFVFLAWILLDVTGSCLGATKSLLKKKSADWYVPPRPQTFDEMIEEEKKVHLEKRHSIRKLPLPEDEKQELLDLEDDDFRKRIRRLM